MKRPFAFAGFSAAIALLFLNLFSGKYSFLLFIISAALLAVSLIVKRIRLAKVTPIVFGAVMLYSLIFGFVWQNTYEPQRVLENKTCTISFEIIDIPERQGDYYIYTVKTERIKLQGAPQNIKALLYTKQKINADYYDAVTARAEFRELYDNGFDSYGSFGNNIFINGSITVPSKIEKDSGLKPLNYYLILVREKTADIITSRLKGDCGALALALLTGDKSGLSDEVYNDFLVCGVSHIIAVSGLHTSVICMGLYMLLRRAGVPIKLSVPLSLAVLLFYVGLTDYPKSVIRSAVMTAILLVSRLFPRKADSLNSLGISVCLLCLNPFAVTDAGAVLTVLAVVGMVYVKPHIDSLIKPKYGKRGRVARYFYDGLIMTFSVMLTSFPAVWLFFGKMSLIAFIANFTLIPLAQASMLGALLMLIFSFLPHICLLFVCFTFAATKLMILLVAFLADNLSFLYVDVGSTEFIAAYLFSLLLVGVSILVAGRVKVRICAAFAVLFFAAGSVFYSYNAANTVELYADTQNCAAVSGSQFAVVYGVDDKYDYYDVRRWLSTKSSENIIFVNCDYDEEKLREFAKNAKMLYNYDAVELDVTDDVRLEYKNSVLSLDIYQNDIEFFNGVLALNGSYAAAQSDPDYEYKQYYYYEFERNRNG